MLNQIIFLAYAFVNLLIAILLYYKLKQNFVSQFFIILVVYLITFIGISSIVEVSQPRQIGTLLSGFLIFIYSMFPFIFLHFIINFIGNFKISKPALTISLIYFTGFFSFIMIWKGFLPNSFIISASLHASSSIFYLTWMSILFAIGVAQLYSLYSGSYNNKVKAKLLFSGFVLLMLILPGPFSETLFSSFIGDYSKFYYLSSTLALIIAVYILFKQKSSDEILKALKLSINFLSDVVLKTDEFFNIELAEGLVSKVLNMEPEDLIGENLNELLRDAGYLNSYKNFPLSEKLSKGLFETKFIGTKGNEIYMSFSIAPVIENETINGYILIGRDISGRKNLEEDLKNINEELEQSVRMQTAELAEMNRRLYLDIEERKFTEEELRKLTSDLKEAVLSKDKMFSIVAHDLRSPFVTLLGMSELLVDEIGDLEKEEAKQFSQNIYNSAKRVYHLLENLLQWSKIQTDRMQFIQEKVNLNKLLSEILILYEGNAGSKGIKISSEIDEDVNLFADQNMLETIIRNLISNAIKFTKLGGNVVLKSKNSGNYTEISVIDSGVGIPKENLSKVFSIEEFVSTPDTENRKGSGLGLILTKEFIEKNGGKLDVESEVGKGTTIKFTVPNVAD